MHSPYLGKTQKFVDLNHLVLPKKSLNSSRDSSSSSLFSLLVSSEDETACSFHQTMKDEQSLQQGLRLQAGSDIEQRSRTGSRSSEAKGSVEAATPIR